MDGYDPITGNLFDFEGCWYHGCTCQDLSQKDPRTGERLSEVRARSIERAAAIRRAGHRLIQMLECDFDKMCEHDSVLKAFVDNVDVPERMNIRQSLYGGWTSCFKLFHDCLPGETIQLYDVCSMYSHCMRNMTFPSHCHPEIITRDFEDISAYFGIAHVKVTEAENPNTPV